MEVQTVVIEGLNTPPPPEVIGLMNLPNIGVSIIRQKTLIFLASFQAIVLQIVLNFYFVRMLPTLNIFNVHFTDFARRNFGNHSRLS